MSAAVSLSRHGAVLVATISNPPVNALSNAVRAGLIAALDELEGDASLVAMVVAADGKTFSAGADVTEFGPAMRPPYLGEVVARLDASAKPVVAAIQGAALGGGLEVALAANARIALASASLGLPEVKLGLLPGAGGILRLPRLVGIAPALEMIAEGKQIAASKGAELGVIDRVAANDLVPEAVAFATDLAASGNVRRASDLSFPEFSAEAQAEARKALAKKFAGREAPQKAVELFAMATSTPFAEAVPLEYEACKALVFSPQSRALRHLFAAERAVAKPSAVPADATPRAIASVGVAGTGTMGRGIVIACLDAGLPVILHGRSDASLEAARQAIGKAYASRVKRGSISQEVVDGRLATLTTATELSALAGVDIVLETIAEDLASKRALISGLDGVLKPDAIVATNTSYLDIEELARSTTRPQNFAGLHFFNPANLMKLVEVVRTSSVSGATLATLMGFAKRLGKTAVLVGPSEGFVANRMLSKRTREALFLLQEGATPAQVDRVLSGFGFPVGPFTLADMAGLDLMAATRAARAAGMSDRERGADIAETLAAAGRLGRKSGSGYYSYGEDGKPVEDPAVAAILQEHRRARGIATREITDEEVLERCLLALVNEGAKLIDEGAVERAADIDVIWTTGLAFPSHLGGPMFWASERGLPEVAARLDHYSGLVGADFFAPAPIVRNLAQGGERFQ